MVRRRRKRGAAVEMGQHCRGNDSLVVEPRARIVVVAIAITKGQSWSMVESSERSTTIAVPASRNFSCGETGRASGGERVCQDVSISVVAVSLKKKKTHKDKIIHI